MTTSIGWWLRVSGVAAVGMLAMLALGGGAPVRAVAPETHAHDAQAVSSSAAAKKRIAHAYGRLPLGFEPNRGQSDARVKFLAHGRGYTLFLTRNDTVLALRRAAPAASDAAAAGKIGRGAVVRMRFAGANPDPRPLGKQRLPGSVNYLLGNETARWHVGIPTFAKVLYHNAYPGIDVIYYGNEGRLEYDVVVRPGANPGQVRLRFQGADKLRLTTRGDVLLRLPGGELRLQRPHVYQEMNGARRAVPGGYVLRAAHEVGFRLGRYDPRRPLVIDPVLLYSTYLGGSGGDDADGIAVDALGSAYLAGTTNSTNFPTTAGAFQTTYGGNVDAFVTKLNATGSALAYSTYLGGSDPDFGHAIAVDALGSAYVAGGTNSTNFPTTMGAFQTTPGGGGSFVTKLSASGSTLAYSTYLGSGADDVRGIAVDTLGSAYLAGTTGSTTFPTTVGAFQTTSGGAVDAFVTKLNAAGSALAYSTYLGGGSDDEGRGIVVDALGSAYLTGVTASTNFPTTVDAFQTTTGGSINDAFVTKLSATGSALAYSTYLGGSGDEEGLGIAVDAAESAYVVGGTDSTDFPATTGAFQTRPGGTVDAFVTKLSATGSALAYSTYLGGRGSGGTDALGVAVDALGSAYVTGFTNSSNFPTTTDAFQKRLGGTSDAFVSKLNATGSALAYSTYLGGSGIDEALAIAIDAVPNPNAYVTGFTDSTNFPTTTGALQTTYGGAGDGFVAKIANVVLPSPPGHKLSGAGSITVEGGIGTFDFIVQQKATGEIRGELQYVNQASGATVESVEITTLVIAGNTATFGGTCTSNGAPCTFTVNVMDNGEPGTSDSFTIQVTPPGSTEGGTLRSGNIQIQN